jgi:glucosamine-phosphate N-acetyltransferase
MTDYLFRKLNSEDYEQYLLLINDFRETMFTQEEFINTLKKIELNSEIWVIEKDKKLIGTGTIIFEKKFIFNICTSAHLEDICIKKEERNCGYGKLLVNFLIGEAKKNKCYKVNLVCNENTKKFYKSCNMEERGVHMSYLITK